MACFYFPISLNFPQKDESNDSIIEVADTLLVCVYTDNKKSKHKVLTAMPMNVTTIYFFPFQRF